MKTIIILILLSAFAFTACSVNRNRYYGFTGTTNSTMGRVYTKSVLSIKSDSSSILREFYSYKKKDLKKSVYYKIDEFQGRTFTLGDTLFFNGSNIDYSKKIIFLLDGKKIILLDHHKRTVQKWKLYSN